MHVSLCLQWQVYHSPIHIPAPQGLDQRSDIMTNLLLARNLSVITESILYCVDIRLERINYTGRADLRVAKTSLQITRGENNRV